MTVVYGFLNRTNRRTINAMITTSLNRSIGVASNMYNDATLAIMNINDTGLMLLL